MPIEIRELVIKASVGEAEGKGESTTPSSVNAGQDEENIVNTCVERVMAILKEKAER